MNLQLSLISYPPPRTILMMLRLLKRTRIMRWKISVREVLRISSTNLQRIRGLMCKEEVEAKRFIRLSSTKRPNLYLRMSNQRRTMTIKPQTLLTINPNLSWRTNPYHSHSMLLSSTKRWLVRSTLKSESRPIDATFSSISQLQSTTSGL